MVVGIGIDMMPWRFYFSKFSGKRLTIWRFLAHHKTKYMAKCAERLQMKWKAQNVFRLWLLLLLLSRNLIRVIRQRNAFGCCFWVSQSQREQRSFLLTAHLGYSAKKDTQPKLKLKWNIRTHTCWTLSECLRFLTVSNVPLLLLFSIRFIFLLSIWSTRYDWTNGILNYANPTYMRAITLRIVERTI